MKKWILLIALGLAVTGCGGGSKTTAEPAPASPSAAGGEQPAAVEATAVKVDEAASIKVADTP
ncbi:MAG: peptidoglycan-binding protein, partial [Anaerolineae bacterium]